MAQFPIGERVILSGLVCNPELNGKCGDVLSFNHSKGRYVVKLMDGTEIAVKAERIAPVEAKSSTSACAKCGVSGASAACSRCLGAKYCSKQCQASHWKEHKQSCTPAGASSTSGCPLCEIEWKACRCEQKPTCWICMESNGMSRRASRAGAGVRVGVRAM